MRAAVLEEAAKPFVIRDDLDVAAPRTGQVRVRVTHCGICHSDLSLADGVFPPPTPIVLGHEAAGVVDAVGPDVTGLARGGTVVYRGVGVGGFGEYALTTATGAVKIDADIPLEVACVIGCAVQTGVGAVLNTARVEAGATVLVMGLGGIGLSIVQGARVAGASRIIAADPVASRRDVARRFGATDVIDPTAEDPAGRALELTGVGVDYAFDAVGRAALIQAGMAACRNGGTTVAVGAAPLEDVITIAPAALFTLSEKKLVGCALGSCNSVREIPRLLALWRAGRLDLPGLITARRPLAEINQAMDDLRASRGIRTVLEIAT